MMRSESAVQAIHSATLKAFSTVALVPIDKHVQRGLQLAVPLHILTEGQA